MRSISKSSNQQSIAIGTPAIKWLFDHEIGRDANFAFGFSELIKLNVYGMPSKFRSSQARKRREKGILEGLKQEMPIYGFARLGF